MTHKDLPSLQIYFYMEGPYTILLKKATQKSEITRQIPHNTIPIFKQDVDCVNKEEQQW